MWLSVVSPGRNGQLAPSCEETARAGFLGHRMAGGEWQNDEEYHEAGWPERTLVTLRFKRGRDTSVKIKKVVP